MSQRVRVTFAKEGPLRWVGHLDLMRTWERAIRRATLPLTYSQGFSPHAKIALAAPLPVGIEGARELIDLWLDDAWSLDDIAKQLNAVMPPGLTISAVEQVPEALPSMQSCLHAARYEAEFATGSLDLETLAARVEALLAIEVLDWEEQRGQKVRRYDLRATIIELTCREAEGVVTIEMHLSLEQGRTGRSAQVLKALALEAEPTRTTRTAIEFADVASTA